MKLEEHHGYRLFVDAGERIWTIVSGRNYYGRHTVSIIKMEYVVE